jgi:hypothetical protein
MSRLLRLVQGWWSATTATISTRYPLLGAARTKNVSKKPLTTIEASFTPVPHMSLLAVYPALIGFLVLFTYLGIRGFTKRVVA